MDGSRAYNTNRAMETRRAGYHPIRRQNPDPAVRVFLFLLDFNPCDD